MIKMLVSRTPTTTLHKIKAHTNIGGNDQADTLAKQGRELDHIDAATPYEHAHHTKLPTKRLVAFHARNT